MHFLSNFPNNVPEKSNLECIVCGKKAVATIWCYSGDDHLPFCSEICFKKACKLFSGSLEGVITDEPKHN
jgi:hypothetical protein